MANENDLENAGLNDEFVSFDELEEKLQEQLDSELSDLSFLEEEKDKIGNPDNLGKCYTIFVVAKKGAHYEKN